jgi:hypothetical protein
MSGDTRIRVGGSWVEPSDIRAYSGGSWSSITEGFARQGGRWVRIWPPRAPQTTDTYDATSTALWHDLSDGWHGSSWGTRPEQGAHPNGGNHRGLWFYGNPAWRNDLAEDGGRRVVQIEMFLRRTSGHMGSGSTGSVRPSIWCHGYNSRPGHKPSIFGGPFLAPSFALEEGKWITLPRSWGSMLVSGRVRGFAVYTANLGPYVAFRGTADAATSGRIRITHD